MARYRLKGRVHINGKVRVLARMEPGKTPDDEPQRVAIRPERQEYECVLLEADTEIELPDDFVPGADYEPLDDAAKAIWAKHPDQTQPAFHNTVDGLPSRLDLRDPAEQIDELKSAVAAMTMAMTQMMKAKSADDEAPRLHLKAKP